jgi:hypothetical protein
VNNKKTKTIHIYSRQHHKIEIKSNTIPADNGIAKLSSIFKGRDSTNIPIVTATKAFKGLTNKIDPKNAHTKPQIVPSNVFFLLKGKGVFPKTLPKMFEKPSPSVRTVIEV